VQSAWQDLRDDLTTGKRRQEQITNNEMPRNEKDYHEILKHAPLEAIEIEAIIKQDSDSTCFPWRSTLPATSLLQLDEIHYRTING
jgi:hypothetical protein